MTALAGNAYTNDPDALDAGASSDSHANQLLTGQLRVVEAMGWSLKLKELSPDLDLTLG